MSTSSLLAPVAPAASKPPACPSKKTTASCSRRTVSCRATTGDARGDDSLLWLPRRDVLTGLGGVAAGLAGFPGLASAADECQGEKINSKIVQCTDPNTGFPCPPPSKLKIVDFTPERSVTRCRRPVHKLVPEFQAKYQEAVRKMKDLPESNPLSFTAQAAIHQAYCDGHYRYDPTKVDAPFDVHFSWIFPPWHRMYIYFYERTLGQLISDDTFALPYWNWDSPAGMVIPPLFATARVNNSGRSKINPLYDQYRNQSHLGKLVDLDVLNTPQGTPLIPFNANAKQQDQKYMAAVNKNLCTVYQQQVRVGGPDPRSFLGEKLCSEVKNDRNSQGTLESMAHTAMHVWVGRATPTPPATCSAGNGGFLGHDGTYHCENDMGYLGTAGRDPLFYSHHANVDRLWNIWSTNLDGGNGFKDKDWLNASFVFYDNYEDPQLVRIKVSDVLDTTRLGYTYEDAKSKKQPWMSPTLTPLVPHGKGSSPPRPSPPAKPPVYPLTLEKNKVVEVPAVALPAKPTEAGKLRVLVIQGIQYDPCKLNKFDVAINVPASKGLQVGPQCTEYAGTFAVVPSSKEGGGTLQCKIVLCIDDVLTDIKADNDSTINLVIVPRTDAAINLNLAPTIQYQTISSDAASVSA
ncbi:Polyphenol oxidase, chloroplastic [Dichanthelium oligosanthes]|uniref:Polyphenol oxidase, chloroplastic n=1 Tax=Dichanthelium oligosanthes TaxID=888268 RepID=A0A1E5WH95_9POAL|nr:Polyphenol oxidase, chloroplastic [Dichanthelium oligosanthes]